MTPPPSTASKPRKPIDTRTTSEKLQGAFSYFAPGISLQSLALILRKGTGL